MRVGPSLSMMLLATVIGCRGLPQPAATPTTHKLRVGQLLITSDFVLTSDHRLVRELTAEREDVSRTLGLPLTDEPIEVYLFSNTDRYRQFLARYFPTVPSRRAFFLESDTSLVVYAHWSDRVAEDLRHEVAHGYLHAAVPGLPLWLDEGLAEFFEVPRGHNGLNRPHVELLSEMMELEKWQPNIAKLEQLSDAAELQQIDYAEAWAWVHFMLQSSTENRGLLISYLADLRNYGQVEPLSARLAANRVELQHPIVEHLASLQEPRTNDSTQVK
jgi:uncharacterized protein DUF1570